MKVQIKPTPLIQCYILYSMGWYISAGCIARYVSVSCFKSVPHVPSFNFEHLAFLTQCGIFFELQPSAFPTDRSKVAFVISLLAGKAKLWGTSQWQNNSSTCHFYRDFAQELVRVFYPVLPCREASRGLFALRQGNRSVAEYIIDFHLLSSESTWNEDALMDVFYRGLNEGVKDVLSTHKLPQTLKQLEDLATRINLRLTERRREWGARASTNPRPSSYVPAVMVPAPARTPDPKPMHLGRIRLTPEERSRCFQLNLCLYCGGEGHRVCSCPVKGKNSLREERTLLNRTRITTSPNLLFPVTILVNSKGHNLSALVDSGADTEFMDETLARRLGIKLLPSPDTHRVVALDGHQINQCQLVSEPIELFFGGGGNHTERLSFLIIESPQVPVVLGFTWLRKHNPQIDWQRGEVLGWAPACSGSCLHSAQSHPTTENEVEETYPDLSKVPEEYHDLKEAFNKSKATALPPHRAYDCSIDLLSGTTPPRGRLYSLSVPESQAMQKYISDSLKAGIIRPSSSPAGAGFFFVGKKDGSLRPCIDYRGLNEITGKNRYPIPLINSAFDQIQGAKIFTK
uniref:Retrotransposon gag domain-containing protein n=1 Tax=Fundulus heteroclitus TaxID=8078 RepID=A0A3Q2QA15_FUNHE